MSVAGIAASISNPIGVESRCLPACAGAGICEATDDMARG